MMQASEAKKSQPLKFEQELKSCAYAVFAPEGLSDEGKPEFLKTEQDIRKDLRAYILSNIESISSELHEISDPTERICITYSLLMLLGDELPRKYHLLLEERMLMDYIGMITAARIIERPLESRIHQFMRDCLKLMLPVVLPLAIRLITKGSSEFTFFGPAESVPLKDLNIFNQITTASELLDLFFSEYGDIEITNIDEYLVWLYECFYFLYILFHQNDEALDVSHIEKITLFIGSKLQGIADKDILSGHRLERIKICIRLLLSMDTNVLPSNQKVYQASKPLLFSLVLDILLPLPYSLQKEQRDVIADCVYNISIIDFSQAELSPRQAAEISIALLSLGYLDLRYFEKHVGSFSLDMLIELVHRTKFESLKMTSCTACLKYLDIILRKSKIAEKDYALSAGKTFFESTTEEFIFIFKGAISRIFELFYECPDNCYGVVEGLHKRRGIKGPANAGEVLEFYELYFLMDSYKAYKDLFPTAEQLLRDLQAANVRAINKAKSWSNNSAFLLFRKVNKSMESHGMPSGEIGLSALRTVCHDLTSRASASTEITLNADDLVFWENTPQLFAPEQFGVIAWNAPQQKEVDELCLNLMLNISFEEDNAYTIFAARLYSIIINMINANEAIQIYPYLDRVLAIINEHHSDYSSEVDYQLIVIRTWLLEYVKRNNKEHNSTILSKLRILPQGETSIINRAVYLYQLAEALTLLVQNAECFLSTEELFNKAEEVAAFMLQEKAELENEIKAAGSIPFEEKVAVLFGCGGAFLGQGFVDLIESKLSCERLGNDQVKITSPNSNCNILAITKVCLTADEIVISCSGLRFKLPLSSIPNVNILSFQVRKYKKDGSYSLFTGRNTDRLIALREDYSGSDEAAEQLTDEQLLDLLGGEKKPEEGKAGKSKAKKSKVKNTAKEAASASQAAKPDSAIKSQNSSKARARDKKQGKKTAAVDKAVTGTNQPAAPPPVAAAKSDEPAKAKKKQGAKKALVPVAAVDTNARSRELEKAPSCSKEASSQKTRKTPSCSTDPDFLAQAGANSFARMILNDEGDVIGVAPASDLPKDISLSSFGVKNGLKKAVARLQDAFIVKIIEKLKVSASIANAQLSLSINTDDASAATIPDLLSHDIVTVSCDLRALNSEQLWPELLKMHASLLEKQLLMQYGGNLAFTKLERDEGDNVAAINLSDYVPPKNKALQRVEFAAGNLQRALAAFFMPFDAETLKFFGMLSQSQVEFILKVMKHAGADLFIYGHAVAEYFYGERLREEGKQTPHQLVIRPSNDAISLDSLRELGAFIQGVKTYAIYCTYKSHNITLCLDPQYLRESIFSGDHFCGLLEYGTFAYSNVSRPTELDSVVIRGSKSGAEIFEENRYALMVALDWSRAMGKKITGGLRKILASIDFLSAITAPKLEGITWHRGELGSAVLSPGAKDYLQADLRLNSSDADAVLEEAIAMMK